MPRIEVDLIKNQGEITHHKPPTCTSLTRHELTHSDPENLELIWKNNWEFLKRYSMEPDYLRNIVLKLQVDC